MSSSTDHEKDQEGGVESHKRDDSLHLILSMADTTWRMFTPPAIFVSAGLYGDLKIGTKPWLTIMGAVIGLAVSVLLVKKQLENSK